MRQRKIWPQVPAEQLMTLRRNRAAEPGSPDKPRPKRTSAQVAKEQAEQEAAKRKAAAAQQATRQAVLDKETEMQKQIKEADRLANHPPRGATKKKVRPTVPTRKGPVVKNRKHPKGTVSRTLTRQETMEIPETEAEEATTTAPRKKRVRRREDHDEVISETEFEEDEGDKPRQKTRKNEDLVRKGRLLLAESDGEDDDANTGKLEKGKETQKTAVRVPRMGGKPPARTPAAAPKVKKVPTGNKDRGFNKGRLLDAMDVDVVEARPRKQVGQFVGKDADVGGPPRSKPNDPVRNKAVTFNEPESEEDMWTDREGVGMPMPYTMKRKAARAERALASQGLHQDQHSEQIGTLYQKRKEPPVDPESDSNTQRAPKKKPGHGRNEPLTGLRSGWANTRKKDAVDDSREPSHDENQTVTKQTDKSLGGARKATLHNPFAKVTSTNGARLDTTSNRAGNITDNAYGVAKRKVSAREQTHEIRNDMETGAENYFAASFADESTTAIQRERAQLESKKATQPKTLVKIGTAATIGPKVRQRALKGFMKKDAITIAHLPPGCHDAFRRRFTPLLRQSLGKSKPWEAPSESDVMKLWSTAFPFHQTQPSQDFVFILTKLAGDRTFEWRNKMAQTALTQYEKYLKLHDIIEPEQIAMDSEKQLGPHEKSARFYYREPSYGRGPSNGIFQSAFIAHTLATHFSGISSIPAEFRSEDRPVGALVMSIQAVKRAILFFRSGVKTVPHGVAGHFSKQNWYDNTESQSGRTMYVKNAGFFLKMTEKLNDQQWDDLIALAVEFSKKSSPDAAEDVEIFAEESSDFELEDGDYEAPSDSGNTQGLDDAFANEEDHDPYRWGYTGSDHDAQVDQLEDD